jgi:hypothetical protein
MKSRISPLLAVAALLALCAAAVPGVSAAKKARGAKAAITKVAVLNNRVAVRGKVKLPSNTARQRKRTRVVFTLTDSARKRDSFKAKLTSKRTFKVTHTTPLVGKVTLRVRVTIGGKASGKALSRKLTVAKPAAAGLLNGTFKLTAGTADYNKPATGSWFQMLLPNAQTPVSNGTSPAQNDNITPLYPGIEGGLRTDIFQEPPNPAFFGVTTGGALASRITRPVPFFNTNFSIVTAAKDPQDPSQTDPLPQIYQENGKLTGQITAWSAQWNGQSFNQGSPKPGGSTAAPTTTVSGSYDVSTRKYVLHWRSKIVGPQSGFNNFVGVWHLEGTFVPAGG